MGWPEGIEPSNVRVTVVSVNRFTMATILGMSKAGIRRLFVYGGADQDRTDDLLNAIQALSQLSYSPTCYAVYNHTKCVNVVLDIYYTESAPVNNFFRGA